MKTSNSKKLFIFSLIAAAFACFALFPASVAAGAVIKMTIPSTFTCADLLVTQAKAEAIWADNAENAEYVPESVALQAIVENQTAKLAPITGLQEKNNSMKIIWLTNCDLDVTDASGECFPDGPEPKSNCKTVQPTFTREVPFQINEDDLRNAIYSKEEVLARRLLMVLKTLDEDIAAKAVAFLEDNEGVNAYAGIGTVTGGTVGNSYTTVAPANWTAAINGYLYQVAKKNRFASPYLVNGSNLFQANWNAEMDAANADGKGNLNKFRSLKTYWDLFNIDGAFANPSSFLIDRSAVFFGGLWRYSEGVTDYGSDVGKRYSIQSRTVPGLRYDVHYLVKCVNDEIIHKFKVIARGGFYLNPTGCTETNTHVLRFSNEA